MVPSPLKGLLRLLHVTALSGCLFFGLSGLIVFQEIPTATQENTVGDVVTDLQLCMSGGTPECTDDGYSNQSVSAFSETDTVQIFIGLRIPDDVTPPTSFSSVSGIVASFTQSTEYTSVLNNEYPTDSSEQWAGYSATVVYNSTSSLQTVAVQPLFQLNRASDGSPFAGPFTFRPVVGLRRLSSSQAEGSAIDCSKNWVDSPDTFSDFSELTFCVDSPTTAELATNLYVNTRDFGILSGATGSTAPGGITSVPFTFQYAGSADPDATFELSTSSDLAGASITPSLTAITPASDSATDVSVGVVVPATTTPGTYNITLTATHSSGQTRTATGTLTVTNPVTATNATTEAATGAESATTTTAGTGVATTITTTDESTSSSPAATASKKRPTITLSVPRRARIATARKRGGLLALLNSDSNVTVKLKVFGKRKRSHIQRTLKLKANRPRLVRLKVGRLKTGRYRVIVSGIDFDSISRRFTLR